jgi:hypothetical protein
MRERYLVHEGHVHHFAVGRDETGWNVEEEEDSILIRQAHLDDWHRVERYMQSFERVALALEDDGWIERREP